MITFVKYNDFVKNLLRVTLSILGNKPKMLIERTKMPFYETIKYAG